MWADVCSRAADDSGGRDVLDTVDRLDVLYCQSWPYDDPPGRLAERLGVAPRVGEYSGIGGTMPQQLVQDAAEAILAGDLDVALVCGGEALATKRALKKQGEKPAWSHREAERSPFPFEAPFHPAEVAHEVFQAWLTFPVFDIARRCGGRRRPRNRPSASRRADGADDPGGRGEPPRVVSGRALRTPTTSPPPRPRTASSASPTPSTRSR
ncbi:MAG: hypothetical protein U5R31_01370 [Acidimicrobiia bacterium]|nr:hypothetical protein [Acidimicrobiia bacterium]